VQTQDSEKLVEKVRERYGEIARTGDSEGCCAPTCCSPAGLTSIATGLGYEKSELEKVPKEADLGLGCGAPVGKLELARGERVLDLGSGAGIDVFIASRQVGPEGHVFGVDMTPDMLARARANAIQGGYRNVEFREGRLEALPIEDEAVDAVTSNCVINLVPDKEAVFREIHRVLKPGGRLAVSDIVIDGMLLPALEKSLLAYVGCVSGALPRDRYFELVARAGLEKVEILKDVDFLAPALEADGNGNASAEATKLLDDAGVKVEEVAGKIRSLTFRAWKPTTPQK
jgi:arsenite methyltransferase